MKKKTIKPLKPKKPSQAAKLRELELLNAELRGRISALYETIKTLSASRFVTPLPVAPTPPFTIDPNPHRNPIWFDPYYYNPIWFDPYYYTRMLRDYSVIYSDNTAGCATPYFPVAANPAGNITGVTTFTLQPLQPRLTTYNAAS